MTYGYGGTFNPTNPPQRSGTFINVKTVVSPRSRAGANGIVGILGQADWGPDNVVVEITSSAQALDMFGTAGTLYFAIDQALTGEGQPDRSGASSVKALRITGSAKAKATKALTNTTPVTALTLTAKYNGSRANSFTITTQTNAVDGTKRDLILYEGTVQREVYTYNGTGGTILASLAAEINARSAYMTAAVNVDGVPLTAVSNSAFTGGNSGASLITGDHAAARAAFEADASFRVFAIDDFAALSSPEQTAYRDWNVRLVEQGKLFLTVVGGLAGETVATATARSVTLDTPDISHVAGMGDVIVNLSRDLIIDGVTYSSSRMAPRVAGIIASAGSDRGISGSSVVGATLSNPPSSSQIEALVVGGVIPFKNSGGLVKLDRGRNTYATSVAVTAEKAKEFKSILWTQKLWYTFDAMNQLTEDFLIGKPIVNSPSQRETILGMFQALLKRLEDENKTIEGATVDYDPSQPTTGETLYLLFKYTPANGIEQVLAQVSVPV